MAKAELNQVEPYYLRIYATAFCISGTPFLHFWNVYSSPRLVVDRMEELIVRLLLVESVSINAQQNMYSIQKKNSQRYSVVENHPNTITNNIRFEKLLKYEYE